MTSPGAVGPGARALGYAGLLPQVIAVGLVVAGHGPGGIEQSISHGLGQTLALGYSALILSFIGGMWWGFAMRRAERQAPMAAIAVVPTLITGALVFGVAAPGAVDWALVGFGVAVLLTLPVDRHLVRTGEAPANWMKLRVPLSIGLGGLTIVAGAVSAGPVLHF